MEMNKAKNLVTYQDEIFSRPPKSWIQKGNSSILISVFSYHQIWKKLLTVERKLLKT